MISMKLLKKKKNESNMLLQTINDYNKIIENQKKFKEERKISENYKQNIENVKIKVSQLLNQRITKYLKKTEDNFLNQIKDKNIQIINKCKNEINNLEEKRNLEFQEKKKEYEKIESSLLNECKENLRIHFNKKCQNCEKNPIKGNLFKCANCVDYYLCEICEQKNFISKFHPHNNFIKIRKNNLNEE